MDRRVIETVKRDYAETEDISFVIEELKKITLDDVMANSNTNLVNTQLAVLTLAEGDKSQVPYYVERAKQDFRDVIFWATQTR